MAVYAGLDVGSVSAKLALVCTANDHSCDAALRGFLRASSDAEQRSNSRIFLSEYRRTLGNPEKIANELLADLRVALPGIKLLIRVTGSGGRLIAASLKVTHENEFKAIGKAIAYTYPDVRTVFEIGGESSKYLALTDGDAHEHTTGSHAQTYATGIADYSTSGECAAGTGSFLDQQATRLKYRVEEIGHVVAKAKCAARIAGRCSVFAKSGSSRRCSKRSGCAKSSCSCPMNTRGSVRSAARCSNESKDSTPRKNRIHLAVAKLNRRPIPSEGSRPT